MPFATDLESGILLVVSRRTRRHEKHGEQKIGRHECLLNREAFWGTCPKMVCTSFLCFDFLVQEGPSRLPIITTRGLLEKCLIVFNFSRFLIHLQSHPNEICKGGTRVANNMVIKAVAMLPERWSCSLSISEAGPVKPHGPNFMHIL